MVGAKIKHKAEAVIKAIKDSAGIKATIATRLGVHRDTVERYLKNYPSAAIAYKNEVEGVGDFVESVILGAIKERDLETAKWYAKNKLRERGYCERYEINKEFKEMSDHELIAFIESRAGADRAGRVGSGTAEDSSPTIH